MRQGYRGLWELLMEMDDANAAACHRILRDHLVLFDKVQGSSHNHQAWAGGYRDHVTEVMNIARVLYDSLSAHRPLLFKLSDALLVLFLHDIEKPWKYELGLDGELRHIESLRSKQAQHEFRRKILEEYGIKLTPEQEDALKYVEGEFDDYTNKRRVMGPLAAFCHLCDVTSARIWFDHPREGRNDPWPGALRYRDWPTPFGW